MRRVARYEPRENREWKALAGDGKRRKLLAIVLNVTLVAVLVGLPYLRGQLRTRAAWRAYDQLSTCMYGELLAVPRAPTPAEEASAFATRALAAAAQLARCQGMASNVAPGDDLLVLPSLKRSEVDLRDAARVLAVELRAMGKELPVHSALSTRPLRAMVQLRQRLEAHSREAGLLESPSLLAARPVRAKLLPIPGRVPLYAGVDAVVSMWGDDLVLQAIGLDVTGLSYLRMGNQLEVATRIVRPGLLRDVLLVDQRVFVLWGPSEKRCRAPGACLGKSLGLAEATLPITSLPRPRWLAAHLTTRADRGLVLLPDTQISLLAEGVGPHELRSFARPELGTRTQAEAEIPPLAASSNTKLASAGEAVLMADGSALQLTVASTEIVLQRTPGGQIASLPAGASSWLTACEGGGGFAFGSDSALIMGELQGGQAHTYPPVALSLTAVVHPSDRHADRVRRHCAGGGALASVLDGEGVLRTVSCHDEQCSVREQANGVASYAALELADGLLLAFAGAGGAPQIRVRSVDLHGQPRSVEQVPAPCWSPKGGLCGAPLLARLGRRVVLAARAGTDLVALESPDDGVSWQRLHGAEPSLPRDLLLQVRGELGNTHP